MPQRIDSKNVGLFGATGMAGTAIAFFLSHQGHRVRHFGRAEFDIESGTVDDLDLAGIEFVINAAGVINRRANQIGFNAQAHAVNSVFPLALADLCEARSVPCVHISTDCVFDGADGKYDERSTTSAVDTYGRTKLLGEPKNAMVLRLSMVGPEQANFYSLMCWFLQQQGACKGFTDHYWNGITTLQLGGILEKIMTSGLYGTGLRHICSTDISKYELLLLFKEAFGKVIDIEPVTSSNPRDMRLRTVYPEFLSNLGIPRLQQQIEQIVAVSDNAGRWHDDRPR